jgi:hypothetical protein
MVALGIDPPDSIRCDPPPDERNSCRLKDVTEVTISCSRSFRTTIGVNAAIHTIARSTNTHILTLLVPSSLLMKPYKRVSFD